jgi:hypothetical protein
MNQHQHPDLADLALFAGRDLPFWKQWQVRRHVSNCPACSAEVASFRNVASQPIAEEMIPAINWEPLASEMRANIRLGLEASEAIAAYRRPSPAEERRLNWRAAAMVASLMVVVSTGWWFAVSVKKLQQPIAVAAQPTVVEATDSGVEISDGNLTLELRTPASRASFVSVTTRGAAETRYTDAETGQITVNHVYLDD